MSKKSNKHIKSIISKIEIDKAPFDFTNKVMQDVFVSSKEDTLKDAALSSLLKKTSDEEPSQEFVSSIMSQVESQIDLKYQPLISKKAWLIISIVLTLFIAFTLILDVPEESTNSFIKVSSSLSNFNNLFTNFLKGLTISPVLTISILSLGILLLLDTYFKERIIR